MARWEDRLFETEPGILGELLRLPLTALAFPYALIGRARAWAFRNGWLASRKLPLPVISIGNLTLGGSGKTPVAIWLAEKLRDRGFQPAISIRGYRSQAERGLLLIKNSSDQKLDPNLVGDEACLIAKRLKNIPVLVGKNRTEAGIQAAEMGSRVLILDDGFQHLKLKRDLDILLLDAGKNIFREKLFPRGRLREPLSALKRAGMVILTRASEQTADLAAQIEKIHPACPVFKMRYRASAPGQSAGKKVFAFAGIADPLQFFELAQSLGLALAGKKSFSDHHYYSAEELAKIEREAYAAGAEMLLTTEKDLARLGSKKTGMRLEALLIEPDFLGDEEKILGPVIKKLRIGK